MKLHTPVLMSLLLAGTSVTAEEKPSEEKSSDEKPADAATAKEAPAAEEEAPKKKREPVVAVGDRPTFSAAAATVPEGHAQLEVGGEFSSSDGDSQIAFPVLVRVGIAEMFELRAGLPSLIVPLAEDQATDVGTVQLGAKIAGDVTDSLSLGAMPFVDIAANSGEDDSFSQSSLGLMLLWGFGLTDDFGIGGNLGAAAGPGSTDEAGPRELFYSASLTAGYSFGKLGVTAEGFTILGEFADTTAGGSLSLGYSVFDYFVVDAYGGTSVQGDASNVFAGAGITLAR